MGNVVAWMGRVALGALVVASLGGCAADANDVAAGVTTSSTTAVAVTDSPNVAKTGVVVAVYALDNNFRAQNTTIHVGDTVRWSNRGKNDHDVLPKTGTDFGVQIAAFHPGETYEHTFITPGVYQYYCSIHGAKAGSNSAGMIGTITVTA